LSENGKNMKEFVNWFRYSSPYINAFRGKTFVLAFGGEVVADGRFVELTHDINLLASLGVKIVLVHGARPQIESRLKDAGLADQYLEGMRVTGIEELQKVKESVGRLRMEIEALLTMGLANSPMANADIRVAGGNFVTAKPVGVISGVDLMYTGTVRKIDAQAIKNRLDAGEIVLLPPVGYSPTGEVFNLTLEEVASRAAISLKADKLIFLMDEEGVKDEQGNLIRELSPAMGESLLSGRDLPEDIRTYLPCAVKCCREGVGRVHLVSRHVDGGILLELFTHEGIGSMITQDTLEQLREAAIDDVGGILALIEPLEAEGVLVRRNRERLEMEIGRFLVLEHDRMVIGCAALYPYGEEGEIACLVVHPEYRNSGVGDRLLSRIEERAKKQGVRRVFVLTTRTAHWFMERGFMEAGVDALPEEKQSLYNYQRRSKVFMKQL
jgi:amino-acid N-acetyltransferase